MPIKVKLADRSYPILIGRGLLARLGKRIAPYHSAESAVIVSDSHVHKIYGKRVATSLRHAGLKRVFSIVIPAGEQFKTLKFAQFVIDKMIRAGVHRDSLLVALGGGVVGDLAGFVAATYMRGIELVQVPTTLLAMVDSAIGGKTAVNHPLCKNLIGAFYQPVCVVSDLDALRTLPKLEFRTGMAEVVKYGVIHDRVLFRGLEDSRGRYDLRSIVSRCSAIKASVVSQDERESGLRMVLNFGHTFGHAIEEATQYKKMTHGEAISLGMVAASRLAHTLKRCHRSVPERIEGLLKKIGLPTYRRLPLRPVESLLALDKKVRQGGIRFVLPRRIGRVEVRANVPRAAVRPALRSIGCR